MRAEPVGGASALLRRLRALMTLVLAAMLALPAGPAAAHEMTIAELHLRELEPGVFAWQWAASNDAIGATGLTMIWPESCRADPGDNHVANCPQGLNGTLAVDGVGKQYSAAMLRVTWLDGQQRVYTLTASQPGVQLYGSADDRRGWAEIFRTYVELGVKHILTGIDHLLFVMGLLFLVGFNRRLVWTITAFTAAHSMTLALSGLGLLTLRPPPVEAAIALSIMLVAGEALSTRETLSRRWPALVAFLFGLVHGLGFAGVLKQIGLPENHVPVALLSFNVGVEIGQLFAVAVAWVVWKALSPWPQIGRVRAPALYAMGTAAAFWAIARIVRIVAI